MLLKIVTNRLHENKGRSHFAKFSLLYSISFWVLTMWCVSSLEWVRTVSAAWRKWGRRFVTLWHKIYFQFSRRTQRAETPQKLIVALAFCLRRENSPSVLCVDYIYLCGKRENEQASLLHLQAKIFSTAISPLKRITQRNWASDMSAKWVGRATTFLIPFACVSQRELFRSLAYSSRLDESKADSHYVCVVVEVRKAAGRLSVLLRVHSIMKRGINQRVPWMKSNHKQWPHERV
jgi:hypothetical protein